MHHHNHSLRTADRNYNEFCNFLFLEKYALLHESIDPLQLHGEEGLKKGFTTYMTVWLPNIDRLMSMVFTKIPGFNPAQLHLIDLGGGKSISTIYLAYKYQFASATSLDIHQHLLDLGKKNLASFNALEGANLDINFLCKCASKLRLPIKGKYLFFAFNPFGWDIFHEFLALNADLLFGSGSLLLYANDLFINELLTCSALVERDGYYNLSVVKF
mgnify:CR=1 FL=1